MEGATNVADIGKGRRKAIGRTDREGQESVIKISVVKDGVDNAVALYRKAAECDAQLNDAIKAMAEKSGLLAATVRKYVVAKASEDFQEHKRKVTQLALVFEVEA